MAKKKSADQRRQIVTGVAYYRYSSHNQTEQSIEGQRRECERYAASHGIRIVREYIDRDISGRTDDRPQLQALLCDAQGGAFEVVLVYTLDRFARNRYDSAVNKRLLRMHGVRVISATEPIPDSPEGVLLESVLEGMAEYFSEELSRKTRRGMRESAYKGLCTGGILPIGYRVGSDKRYRLDPASAPLVCELFKRYAAGERVKDILQWARAVGLHTQPTRKAPAGMPLTSTTLHHMLSNTKYIGTLSFDGVTVPDALPRIVDDALFAKCQERREERKIILKSSKARNEYLLTGKLTCGKCGAFLFGDSGANAQGTVYRYYACSTRKNGRRCDCKRWRKDDIENLILDYTRTRVLTPENIKSIAADAAALQTYDTSTLEGLQARLMDVRSRHENLLSAIEQGIITPKTKERLQELEDEEASLEQQIADEKINLSVPRIDARVVEFWLEDFREMDLEDLRFRRRLVDALINQIFLFDDHLVIAYNYKDGTHRIGLEDLPADAVLCASECNSDGCEFGSPGKTRTYNTPVNSRVLCH